MTPITTASGEWERMAPGDIKRRKSAKLNRTSSGFVCYTTPELSKSVSSLSNGSNWSVHSRGSVVEINKPLDGDSSKSSSDQSVQSPLETDGEQEVLQFTTEILDTSYPTLSAYGDYFYGKKHRCYIGGDKKSPLFLFAVQDKPSNYRCLLWTPMASIHFLLRVKRRVIKVISLGDESFLKAVAKADFMKDNDVNAEDILRMDRADTNQITRDVLTVERKFFDTILPLKHKFGCLYVGKDQTTELEILGNKNHSKHFEDFMNLISNKTPLKGHERFAGGLDVKKDTTGTHSYYHVCNIAEENREEEILFHCATMIPVKDSDTQFTQKKKHIGNDIGCLVFIDDPNTSFDPSCFRTKFIQYYLVVRRVSPDDAKKAVYESEVVKRNTVFDFPPVLPTAQSEHDQDFAAYITQKLIMGHRYAMLSVKSFIGPISSARVDLLSDIAKKKERTSSLKKDSKNNRFASVDNILFNNRRRHHAS
eukprot:Clim_evm81s128 gene=Clim_evmTU81s128